MRSTLLTLILGLALATAGCIKEDPVEAATDEPLEAPPEAPPADPTPASPSSPPPSSPPASTTPPPTPTPEPEEPPAPPAPAPRVDVLSWNGTLTAAGASAATPAGELCCVQAAAENTNADVRFEVPAGLKGIVVELTWADTQFDVDLIVAAPDYDPATPAPPQPYTGHRWVAAGGTPGQPDGHARVSLTDADALALLGSWGAHATAKGPVHAVPFTLHVSLFYDAAPAADYTAAP